MDISIIIVNYNQKNFLKQCLKNIAEANIKLDYEVIVVDNASYDSSKEYLSSIQLARRRSKGEGGDTVSSIRIFFNKKNVGFARAVNQGVKMSKGKYILVLNPDIIVLPCSVEKLFQFMEEHSEIGIAGPQLLNPDKTVQFSCRRFPKWYTHLLRRTFFGKLPGGCQHLRWYLMMEWDHRDNREVDWLMGAALMVRRKTIDKAGLMDERFFLYFEDTDWCRCFHQAGWRVFYVVDSQMYHFHQRLSAEHTGFPALFSKITWIHIASAIKYFWKWR